MLPGCDTNVCKTESCRREGETAAPPCWRAKISSRARRKKREKLDWKKERRRTRLLLISHIPRWVEGLVRLCEQLQETARNGRAINRLRIRDRYSPRNRYPLLRRLVCARRSQHHSLLLFCYRQTRRRHVTRIRDPFGSADSALRIHDAFARLIKWSCRRCVSHSQCQD
jgi:hypothetical protein